MAKDYYKTLGVDRSASAEDIKKAYRKAAHQHHPDKSGGDEARFKEVNEAYQVLGNADKKARYDRTGSADDHPGAGAYGGFSGFGTEGFNVNMEDLNDIFSSMFSGGFGGGHVEREDRGRDLHVEFQITLEDAFRGGTHEFRIPALVTCEVCEGSGAADGSKLVICSDCDGRGQITQLRRTILGQFQQKVLCPKCEGNGKVPEKPCPKCSGEGRRKGERNVTFKFEPGIADGQLVAVPEMGDAGRRKQPTGSLGVRVRVVKHNIFTREGDNLVADVKVSPIDLVLHKIIHVPAIGEGTTPIELGSNVDLAERYKVKGYGMPHYKSRGRGDLLVRFHVVTGKRPGKREKEVLEEVFES